MKNPSLANRELELKVWHEVESKVKWLLQEPLSFAEALCEGHSPLGQGQHLPCVRKSYESPLWGIEVSLAKPRTSSTDASFKVLKVMTQTSQDHLTSAQI